MNELKIIEQREVLGKEFKVYGDFENPLFLAKDVAEWIEHSNSTEMLRGIDEAEKLNSTILSAGRGGYQNREVAMVTEDGLYEILMQSRKPIAKQFKAEVKKILKDIRKHGMYAADELLNNPDFLLQVATTLKEERDRNKKLAEDNSRMRPKEIFADAVCASHTSILIGELSKILRQNGVEIGQNRLFGWLRDNGYLIRRGSTDWNMPTQRSMEMELFRIKERTISNPDGSVRITKTVLVTGKGQQYFVNKFLGLGA